ncbi:MAG: glutamate racemase [Ruthenibacterium sp.]
MQTPDKNAPIGVFDSGLGGLSAVRELRRILPHENIVYFGDTGRVPYGTRGTETIVQYAKQDIAFLLSQRVKFILAACGTVSSTLPKNVSDALPIPYRGVVVATAAAAIQASKSGRIGVIGTPATIKSGSYCKALAALNPHVEITATSCPLFVPLVENGYFGADNKVTTLVAEDYLAEIKRANVDTLILGCTHYPLIQPILAKMMGENVTLIDAGRESAAAVKAALLQDDLLCERKSDGTASYFVSDSTENFAKFSDWFLGEYAGGSVTQIDIEQYNLL